MENEKSVLGYLLEAASFYEFKTIIALTQSTRKPLCAWYPKENEKKNKICIQ